MFISNIFYINPLEQYKNRKYSLQVSMVVIIMISFLISAGAIATPLLLQMANAQAAAARSGTSNTSDLGSGALQTLSLDYGTKGKTFEPVNERFKVSNAILTNNDNFTFFSDRWHDMSHGDIFRLQYSTNPLNTILKLVPVLNPIPNGHQDYKAMKLGQTIITPPPASRDNRTFAVANDVPNGYYLVNAYGKFGGTNNFGEVFTGKMRLLNATSSNVGSQLHSVKTIIHRTDGPPRPTGFGPPCDSPRDLFDPLIWGCITPDGAIYIIAANTHSPEPCQVDITTGVCVTNPNSPSPTVPSPPTTPLPSNQRQGGGGGHHHNGGGNPTNSGGGGGTDNGNGGGGGGGNPTNSGGGGGTDNGNGGGSAAPPDHGGGGPVGSMQEGRGGGDNGK
jgi:uncharacterized membrane protein YgcG